MTIQQCRYVLEIAKTGSFNEAAKQLFVAQSSLSVSVKALEEELNIRIFERSKNGVHLTGEGAEFVRYAREIVDNDDFIKERYASYESGIGAEIVSGRATLESLEAYALAKGEVLDSVKSGRQEYLEAALNALMFG